MSTTVKARRAGTTASHTRWLLWGSVIIAVAAFLVRLVGVAEPMGPDQGVYATIGWGLQRGLALYKDLWELKPPGIYLTYWFGFTVFGTREASIFWVDYLAGALTALVIFDLGRRVVSVRFGALAAAVFALGTLPAARHAYGGFLERAISEKFISLLAASAAWATAMAVIRKHERWSFAAGVLVGAAVVYKPFALVYFPAFLAWTWLTTDTARASRYALWSAVGVAVAPLAAIGWMASQGVLGDAWMALVQFNRAYLAVGGQGPFEILHQFAHQVFLRMKTDEVWALGSVSAVMAVCAWRWRSSRAGSIAALGVLWLAAALVAIPANGPRMFMTYFVPSLVPLCLLTAWLLDQTIASGRRLGVAAGVLVLMFSGVMLVRSGSVMRAATMTAWDARYLFGQLERNQYLERFGARNGRAFSAASNAQLSNYVAGHTRPDERIFMFGMTAGTYFTTRRLPASRFLFVYPAVSRLIDRPEFRVETLAEELAHTAPRYIVLQRHNGDSFSGWKAQQSFDSPPMVALLRNYTHETEIGDFALYRRSDGVQSAAASASNR